jgi:hypothetical protein
MTADEALAFVREHGIVLASAKGPVPRLADAIAGEPIKGSWWAHPKSHRIFGIFQGIANSPDVLVCRLIDRKVTFVHRRLWPALVRLADRIPPDRLCQVREEHTPSGHHVSRDIPFPAWVPPQIFDEARALGEQQARSALGPLVLSGPGGRSTRSRGKGAPR